MNRSENNIIKSLRNFYLHQVQYCANNIYLFKYNWESDFFILRKNGYCAEYEIKISKSDFKADFKKEQKHSILKTGSYIRVFKKYNQKIKKYESIKEIVHHKLKPNKFFYVVPENMIKVKDIPIYSGLIYVSEEGNLTTIKEAPFLHKEKLGQKLIKDLCYKFYWRLNNYLN